MEKLFESNPTHFIEQFKAANSEIISIVPLEISFLNSALLTTKKYGHKTLAIFKITPKKTA